MPKKYQLAVGVLASVIIFDYVTITRLKIHNIMLLSQVHSLEGMLFYLGDVLEKHDVELDEFDMIALTNVSGFMEE